jgi:hypothetical protein
MSRASSAQKTDPWQLLDDLEETTTRPMRVSILTDCLLERLVELRLDDGSDYLDRIEEEIATILTDASFSAVGHLFDDEAKKALAMRKRRLLRLAIREEFLESGLDSVLWNQAMACLTAAPGAVGYTPNQTARFLQICRMYGWTPLWNGGWDSGSRPI